MKSLPMFFTIPRAMLLQTLRDALANNHLHAVCVAVGPDGVKVTPSAGIDRAHVEIFVKGFIAGFDS